MVVVLVVAVARALEAEEAFAALGLVGVLTSQAAVLVRRIQPSEERPTVEVESASAPIILQR